MKCLELQHTWPSIQKSLLTSSTAVNERAARSASVGTNELLVSGKYSPACVTITKCINGLMSALPDELLLILDTYTAVINMSDFFKGRKVPSSCLQPQQSLCSTSDQGNETDPLHVRYKTITISCIKDKFIHMYAHMLTFDTYCTVCMCALL